MSNLRHHRESLNLTQKDIAQRTGLEQSEICRIESGMKPNVKHWKKLARAYELSDKRWKEIWR